MLNSQWEDVVKKMLLIEEEVFGNKEKTIWKYRQFKNWVLRDHVWPGQVISNFKMIPGLRLYPLPPNHWKALVKRNDWGSLAGPFLGWHIKHTLEAPLKVDALRVYNCLVGIYVNSHHNLIIKSAVSENKKGRLLQEAENLHWVYNNMTSKYSNVRVPRLHYLKSNSHNTYLVQELLTGRAAKDKYPLETILRKKYWQNIAEIILQFTWLMYESWGIKYIPIREAYSQFADIDKIRLEHLSLSDSLKDELQKLFDKCSVLLNNKRLAPCSFRHGDLVWEHVVIDEHNQIWLIDWGSAKVGPIIDDQEKLINMLNGNAHISKQIADYFQSLSALRNNLLSFTEQRILWTLKSIIKIKKKVGKGQSGYDPFSKRNMPYTSLEVHIKKEVYKVWNLMYHKDI